MLLRSVHFRSTHFAFLAIALLVGAAGGGIVAAEGPQLPLSHPTLTGATLVLEPTQTTLVLGFFAVKDWRAGQLYYVNDGSGTVDYDRTVQRVDVQRMLAGDALDSLAERKDYILENNPAEPRGSYLLRIPEAGLKEVFVELTIHRLSGMESLTIDPSVYDLLVADPPEEGEAQLEGAGTFGDTWDPPFDPCIDIDSLSQVTSWQVWRFEGRSCAQGYHDVSFACDGREQTHFGTDGAGGFCGVNWRDSGQQKLNLPPGSGGIAKSWTPCYRPPSRDGSSGPFDALIRYRARVIDAGSVDYGRFRVYTQFYDMCGGNARMQWDVTLFQCFQTPFWYPPDPTNPNERDCSGGRSLFHEREFFVTPAMPYLIMGGLSGAAPGGNMGQQTCTVNPSTRQVVCAENTVVTYLDMYLYTLEFEIFSAPLLPIKEESS